MRAYYSPSFQNVIRRLAGGPNRSHFEMLNGLSLFESLRALAVLGPQTFGVLTTTPFDSLRKEYDKVGAAIRVVDCWRRGVRCSEDVLNATYEQGTAAEFLKWFDDGSFAPQRRKIFEQAYREYSEYGENGTIDGISGRRDGVQSEGGKRLRKGAERLLRYFRDAYGSGPGPGKYYEDNIKFRREGLVRHIEIPDKNGTKKTIDVELIDGMDHWCGIFATSVIKNAGLTVGNWVTGLGASATMRKMDRTEKPKVGDVGYIHKANHHFLVAEVSADGSSLRTIDGNAGTYSTITASGWLKFEQKNAAGFFSAFGPKTSNGNGFVGP